MLEVSQRVSPSPSTPILASTRRKTALLSWLKSILVRYRNIRQTHADARKLISPMVKVMHRTLCRNMKCECRRISCALFHVDTCHNQECIFCKSLGSTFQTPGRQDAYVKRSHESKINDFPSKRAKVVSSETTALCGHGETTSTKVSENEKSSVKKEKVVGGKSELAKQVTKSDPNRGVSILDFLTEDELQEHLLSLRLSTDQDAEGSNTMSASGESTCNLCGMEKLMFAPKPIYCSTCGCHIKNNAMYYYILDCKAAKSCVCTTCFKGHLRNIPIDGISISKSMLKMAKNKPIDEEPWVQCDKCGGWQHQICGLYNDKNDLGGKAEYRCPKCYLLQIIAGKHVPIQNTSTFGAKNLPTTKLSDYIEKRLFRRLKEEREERAKASKKCFSEVPGATDLFVRVVVSSNKLLEVNKQFLEVFQDEKYPSEFPYRAKVIILFQKIGGVDVCLFAIYVQEYGSECGSPNQQSIYISHLDSVKYFRPETRSAYGESLRTFVYHEILIGYLDYCKKRGFATAYIWSCPPVKGDDFIFYCHPETQKTPTPDQLRQWYKSMLRKASKEKIVIGLTNFYDHFFVTDEEKNTKVSAAHLPYFEDAYWCGAAIDIIKGIEKEIEMNRKKKVEQAISRRSLKALGVKDLSEEATKDILLMEKLGKKILPFKEEIFVVHLQLTCKHCHEVVTSGPKWLCKKCKNFLLCSRCHKTFGYSNSHLFSSRQRHTIYRFSLPNNVADDTEDADINLETNHFENRAMFLGFCQGNQLRDPSEDTFRYQFDSLRRAKHSSMMILYYLHSSIQKTVQDSGEKVGKAEVASNKKIKKLLNNLSHFSHCKATQINGCTLPGCEMMRNLFYPSRVCSEQVENCELCKTLSFLLKKHAEDCENSSCRVPHCMEIKKRENLFPT